MYIYFKMYENILRINEAKKLLKNFYVLYKFINIYCNQIVILLYIMIRNGQTYLYYISFTQILCKKYTK